MTPLKVFVGYDHRQPIAYNVLQHSIISQSSKPVSITPLVIHQLECKRTGLTPFTFSRFMVPHLCDYEGWALFLDLDMVVKDDIAKLFDLADDRYSIMVAKNVLKFEWASVMLFNCAKNRILTPDYIGKAAGLHKIGWLPDDEIGNLPPDWNLLVGYDQPIKNPKLIHYTQGIPLFPETRGSDYAKDWETALNAANMAVSWTELMGESVHAERFEGKLMPKYEANRIRDEQKIRATA
jgi:lipopolysaccharide biosynthesis glycosyltransferase